jgi:hypothetical protein
MSTKEKLIEEITNELKSKGIVEVKYEQYVEGGRNIEVKHGDGKTFSAEQLDDETTDNIDTLLRLLEHLKKIPDSEEGDEVQIDVNGLTFKYLFWA